MHRVFAGMLVAGMVGATLTVPPPAQGARHAAIAVDTVPLADRIRLAEAFRLAATLGDSVWPGWSRAPFAVLLVTPDREFLIGHPQPAKDFVHTGFDSVLATDVWVRPRTLPTGLLATFPVFDSIPVIVVGTARNAGQRSTAWVLTVLHEHFHQWQMTAPHYQERVSALGLARGDSTGMWMLNYPFPYARPGVRARVGEYGRSLTASDSATPGQLEARDRAAYAALLRLRRALAPDDARYLGFQLWQEGVARYTELRMAQLASREFVPGVAMTSLPDFTAFGAEADSLAARIHMAGAVDLAEAQRVAFYPLGAAQAVFLDHARPGWKARYRDGPLSLEPLGTATRRRDRAPRRP